ncbi:MAG: hypothetical protein EOP11_00915 [Proteobacteria bacterium]|nr:MAG: hypothetical protein EOP11_00915 [Pseudomonadota bacterium]
MKLITALCLALTAFVEAYPHEMQSLLTEENPSGVCHRRSGCLPDQGDFRSSLKSCHMSAFYTDGGQCISL